MSELDERQDKRESRAKAHAVLTEATNLTEALRDQVREALRAAGHPDDLLDRYDAARAHEAGAKIRRHAEGPCMYVAEAEQVWWQTVHRVADLIDPDGAE